MWGSTSHWTFLKWCWILGCSYHGYVSFFKLISHFEPVIPNLSFSTCHSEPVILNLSYLTNHSKSVVLNRLFWICHSEPVIPNLWFWICNSKPVISNLSFQNYHFKPVKWNLSFQSLNKLSFYLSYFKTSGLFHKSSPTLFPFYANPDS